MVDGFEQQPLEVVTLQQRQDRISRGFDLAERRGGSRALGQLLTQRLPEQMFRPSESKEFFSKIFQEFDPARASIAERRGFATLGQGMRGRLSRFMSADSAEEAAKAFSGPGVETDFLPLLQSALGEDGDLGQFQEVVSRAIAGKDIEQPIESSDPAFARQPIQTVTPEEAIARAQNRKEIVQNIRGQIGQTRAITPELQEVAGQEVSQSPEEVSRTDIQELRQLTAGGLRPPT